jgi:hypothetical protein
MLRFFWRSIFELPEVAGVSQYMRLDGDSCLLRVDQTPFSQLANGVVYLSNDQFYDLAPVCVNLRRFVEEYVKYFKIAPKNPLAWNRAFIGDTAAGYYNNLEVMDIAFWLRPDVQHFVQFVDASHGIYLHRWGDAPLRYLALALFATSNEVEMKPYSWYYIHPCREN